MTLSDILTIVALLLGSGGIASSIIAWRRYPLEKKRAEVDIQAAYLDISAKVQEQYSEIIEELSEHITALDHRLEKHQTTFRLELNSQQTIIDDLKIRLKQTEERLREEIDSNRALAGRVAALEEENKRLRAENARLRCAAA
jgi:chromosome segregation ATPase